MVSQPPRPVNRATHPTASQQGGTDSDCGTGGSQPSPWLEHPLDPSPSPGSEASFVEYLRWMRSPDSQHKDPTKLEILQMAEGQGNHRDRLTQLTNRTRLIAGEGNTFQVKCLWRIRVGGHRGPESILLPAFDALGMPYIPSSTLRGVARTQAIRELMEQEGLPWTEAQDTVSRRYFGCLESERTEERLGKVTFLDAYPLPQQSGNNGGLRVDMANNIWSWENEQTCYSPNPNPFLSLKESTFLVGIRPTSSCDNATLQQVRDWLSRGLQAGAGSQVNTGYGCLIRAGQAASNGEFFNVDFTLEGQLIHGRQEFTEWRWDDRRGWQMRGRPDPEVRPVAFKSMLRYWFRAFAQGVISPREVQRLEGHLFGAINPQQVRGWVTVRIANGQVNQPEARPTRQGQRDPRGEQSGRLILAYSSEAPGERREVIASLFKALTWMMFHLGGVGQGARRPCYSRRTRDRAPWWRGSTLIPEGEDPFWELPDDVQEFRRLFWQRFRAFYGALGNLVGHQVDPQKPQSVGRVSRDRWTEAIDANCRIIVCSGEERFGKPYPLALLHGDEFKVPTPRGRDYDGNLCGQVRGRGGVKPSPVWIADLGEYQVVTVFGATQDLRRRYVDELRRGTNRIIWPLPPPRQR